MLYDFAKDDKTLAGQYIMKCPRCGLVYYAPIPDKTFIEDAYGNYLSKNYYHFQRLVEEGHESHEIRRFTERLAWIRRYKQNGRLLEIGSFVGLFLHLASQSGFEVYAVEPDKEASKLARQRCQKVKIYNALFEDVDFVGEKFDLIVLWDVIEHVTDPTFFLQKIAQLLKPGGMVFLETPDVCSLLHRAANIAYRLGWYVVLKDVYGYHHLYYFSKATMIKYLEKVSLNYVESLQDETHLERLDFKDRRNWVNERLIYRYGIRGLFLLARLLNRRNKLLVCGQKE